MVKYPLSKFLFLSRLTGNIYIDQVTTRHYGSQWETSPKPIVHRITMVPRNLGGRWKFLGFSLLFIPSFWNLYIICRIGFRNDFWYEKNIFFSIFEDFGSFLKKIQFFNVFSHSNKKNRSQWVFMLHRLFTYQNLAKSIMKRLPGLDFRILAWNFFHEQIFFIGKKWNPVLDIFHKNYLISGPYYKTNMLKIKNPNSIAHSLCFQLSFDMWVISVA